MVGHMNIEEQADVDFARRRAFLRRIGGRPSNGSYRDRLLCFEDTRGRLGALGGDCRGLRGVRPTDVIGFRPANDSGIVKARDSLMTAPPFRFGRRSTVKAGPHDS